MDIHTQPNRLLEKAEGILSKTSQYFEDDYTTICEAITTFENEAKKSGYSETNVDHAKFFLCAFLDEMHSWKIPLLKSFYGSNHNKDYEFYDRLEKLRDDINGNIDLLELSYLCFSLGFRGKYRHDPSGNGVIKVMDSLYNDIRHIRGDGRSQLSETPPKPEAQYWRSPPIWLTAIIAIAILFSIYIPYKNKLSEYASPVIHMLSNVVISGQKNNVS